MGRAEELPGGELEVDLETQTVGTADGRWSRHFEIDPFKKYRLLRGLDDISMTLEYAKDIGSFEARRPAFLPSIPAGG
jgi:3-isopropylmalate dehydratase small subunit